MSDIKQVIVMRKDLNMRKGKMVAQGAHASWKAILNIAEYNDTTLVIPLTDDIKPWLTENFKKICVSVDSEKELLEIYENAKNAHILCGLITDSGLTEFNGVPTNTCIAVGPGRSEEIDKICGHLKLL